MRKISSLLVAAALVVAASFSTMAADINSAEQAVLDELKSSVRMSGAELVISDEYQNQTKNYFNTIDMTDEQSTAIIAELKKAETLLESSSADNIGTLTKDQKSQILNYGKNAVANVGLTMTYNNVSKEIVITDADGNVVFRGKPTLVKKAGTDATNPTGATSATNPTSSNNGGSSTNNSNTTNSGTTSGNTTSSSSDGKVADSNVIKTTGANVNTSAVAGVTVASVIMAAAGATYVVKTRKERA